MLYSEPFLSNVLDSVLITIIKIPTAENISERTVIIAQAQFERHVELRQGTMTRTVSCF